MSTDLVTIRNLHVRLGSKSILDGVDAELPRGKITALIGLNGAGKSTLLRALVKEVPYSGEIRFHCGHDHHQPTPEHVGYVPQKLRIEANLPLTVYDLFGLAMQRRPLFLGVRRSVRRRTERMLERVGAEKLMHQPVARLSGGELQRVLLALALDPEPELLLLDEPAAGIDFKDSDRFYDLIANLNRQTGVTMVLVSHELSMVGRMAHHVLCLEGGRIGCRGTVHDVLNEETLGRIFGHRKGFFEHTHVHTHSTPESSGERG
jgi:zinc transport system ATP-binding protein